MQSFNEIWATVVSLLSERLNNTAISTWIDKLEPVSLSSDTATLCIATPFQKNIIDTRYKDEIAAALADVLGFDVAVECVALAAQEEPDEAEPGNGAASSAWEEEYTFDSFVVGSSNKLAHAAAIAVARTPTNSYNNPLFLHGGSGLGKTHLLYAIKNEISLNHPEYKIAYLQGEDFTNELIDAIKNGSTNEFRLKYRHLDVLLIDDIQFIAGKESTQEELFHTFNSLYTAKKQIVLSADRPPKDMQTLEERLRSRFEWGIMVDIHPPDVETRMAIIKRKADMLSIPLPDDVVNYIAERVKSNIRQLEGAVKKIKAFHQLNGEEVTMLVAQNAIKDILNENIPLPVTIERIVRATASFYSVSPEDVRGKKKNAEIALARQVAMYLVRDITDISFPSIGREFGGRDHSTVMHAVSKIEETIRRDPDFAGKLRQLAKNVNGET